MTDTAKTLFCCHCRQDKPISPIYAVDVFVWDYDSTLDYIENYCSVECYKAAYPGGASGRCEAVAVTPQQDTVPASVAEIYEQVTTRTKCGGIGVGRFIHGRIFENAGNGFYYPSVGPDSDLETMAVVQYRADGGEAYITLMRHLFGSSSEARHDYESSLVWFDNAGESSHPELRLS